MQIIRKIIDFYVFSNIHVALAAGALTIITSKLYGNDTSVFPFFVFLSTLLSYNFIRLYRKDAIKSWLYEWIHSNKVILYVLSGISILCAFYLGLKLKVETLLLLIPFSVLTLFYVIPVYSKKSLRSLPGFKLFLISFCWASVTVLLPMVNEELYLSKDIWITFIQRFFFVATITIPFDIRDVKYDTNRLKTLPQVYGEAKAKRIGMFFLMLFLGGNFLKSNSVELVRIEFIVTLLSLFLLIRSTAKQSKYYSAFFVEAIPLVWLLLIMLFIK